MKRFVIYYQAEQVIPNEFLPDGSPKIMKVAKGNWIGSGKKSVVTLHRNLFRERMMQIGRMVKRNPELLEGVSA